jgi:hypothetical protein
MTEKINLTPNQKDYAVFLPAISGFYSGYVGKQRHSQHIDAARMPTRFEHGVEGLNFLNPDEGYFQYKWGLYSAGHANLDMTKFDMSEDMIRNRDKSSFILGDSGGFQIGKGVWEGDWRAGSGCAKAQKYRQQVLDWMEANMNYGMTLDIPGWVGRSPKGAEATKITTYDEAVEASKYNFEYWMKNRKGNCKFLTVLQGDTHKQADQWYDEMKGYCDPKQYPNDHFNGWAMGSQNKCDVHLILRRLVAMIWDGLLESGKQDWIHYLGTSKLEWAIMFTDIQRAIRKYHNPTLSISFDCASPFLATANGQVYWQNNLDDAGRWSYQMSKCVDDKKYSNDPRMFRDVMVQDHYFESFIESPIIDRMEINDVCVYGPTDLNKIGKIGRTSWDSFAYALLMGHNVYAHIKAVQDGNDLYDQGIVPAMLRDELRDKYAFRQLVDAIFSAKTRGEAMKLVDDESKWYLKMPGSSANGNLGKKAMNALTSAEDLFGIQAQPKPKPVPKVVATVVETPVFEFVAPVKKKHQIKKDGKATTKHVDIFHRDDSGLDEDKLDKLEESET